ncbi:MAG: sulfur-oxidizing protein SoxX [Alphaproteobacteria bacterium]
MALQFKTCGIVAVTALTALAVLTGGASAEAVKPGDVKITDGQLAKSLTGKAGDPVAGKKTFVGRKLGNCLACHVNKDTSKQQFHGEVGPALDGAASRYEPAALRAIIVNSKQVFGEQTLMPGFYREAGLNRVNKKFKGKTILSAQQVEDVLAYVLTLKK